MFWHKISETFATLPDIKVEAAKGTPAIIGAAASVWTLNTWVILATGVYVVVQIAYLLRKWWREEADYQRRKRPRAT